MNVLRICILLPLLGLIALPVFSDTVKELEKSISEIERAGFDVRQLRELRDVLDRRIQTDEDPPFVNIDDLGQYTPLPRRESLTSPEDRNQIERINRLLLSLRKGLDCSGVRTSYLIRDKEIDRSIQELPVPHLRILPLQTTTSVSIKRLVDYSHTQIDVKRYDGFVKAAVERYALLPVSSSEFKAYIERNRALQLVQDRSDIVLPDRRYKSGKLKDIEQAARNEFMRTLSCEEKYKRKSELYRYEVILDAKTNDILTPLNDSLMSRHKPAPGGQCVGEQPTAQGRDLEIAIVNAIYRTSPRINVVRPFQASNESTPNYSAQINIETYECVRDHRNKCEVGCLYKVPRYYGIPKIKSVEKKIFKAEFRRVENSLVVDVQGKETVITDINVLNLLRSRVHPSFSNLGEDIRLSRSIESKEAYVMRSGVNQIVARLIEDTFMELWK